MSKSKREGARLGYKAPDEVSAELSPFYRVSLSKDEMMIECTRCDSCWTWPVGKPWPVGETLHFLNHRRMHSDTDLSPTKGGGA